MEPFFLPYQTAWIRDRSRIKLMEKSRQIGMSWTTAYELVRRHCLPTAKYDSWISSRDELQAKLFIDDCKKFAAILDVAVSETSGGSLVDGSDSRSLGFSSGTRIWSLSSNPDAQAGKRGARVLDEFALHPDPERLYAVAYPGITWGGSLQIISTHRGGENFFRRLVDEARYGGNPKKISLHRITLQDALEQGLLRKIKASLSPDSEVMQMDEAAYFDYIKNSCADTESFMQEYMCCPADERGAFLDYGNIRRCTYTADADWRAMLSSDSMLFLGVDVGRTRDLTVFWLLEKCGEMLFTRDVRVFRDVPFSEQEAVLHTYLKLPRLRRAAIDRSGLGRQFAERAAERYGSGRIEGVSFTRGIKEELAYPLRTHFENGTIRIPDDLEIAADLHAVKKEASGGGVVFRAERSADGHADRFWALALAAYSARTSCGRGEMELVGKKPSREFMW